MLQETDIQHSAERNQPPISSDLNLNEIEALVAVQNQVAKNEANRATPKQCQDLEGPKHQATTSADTNARATPELAHLSNRPEVEPLTPERVKKPALEKRPAGSTPKVLYRVGLSKRVRIAPLLRTVKK